MINSTKRNAWAVACGLMAVAACGHTASATEGYFQPGYGAVQQGTAGAGVASTNEAMSLSLNPAGLARAGTQFQMGVSLFMPTREYTASNTLFVAPGTNKSGQDLFAVPNFAYSRAIDANSSWGIAMFGNGGMNTKYAAMRNNQPFCGGGFGVFCGGTVTGVNLSQAFMTIGYARQNGALSWGIAPILAFQKFSATGFNAFTGSSLYPRNMTDQGSDHAWGGGVRAGVQYAITPGLRLGLSGQTKILMTQFDKYRGLFAGAGGFDIPANITAGLSYDVMPSLTLMLDYKRIFYTGVDSISNSSRLPNPFGSTNGPGFGWHDVNVYAIGAEWRATQQLTLRAGYAFNDNPIKATDVTMNIVAPGVVKHHITGGFSYKLAPQASIDFAAIYVPKTTVSGPEVTALGPTAGSNIRLGMSQFQATLGFTYKFDAPAAPVVRKY